MLLEETPENETMLDYVIIGAGISGLSAGKRLADLGYRIQIFEKSRGTGGRLSSKRLVGKSGDEMAFDLGCSRISAQGKDFKNQLESWHLKGVVAPWETQPEDSKGYVGYSRNSALTRYLSQGLACHFSTKISHIECIEGGWQVFYKVDGCAIKSTLAKQVILALPSQQAYDLLPKSHAFCHMVKQVHIAPQWVMAVKIMADSKSRLAIDYRQSDIIDLISYESTKPGRNVESNAQILMVQACIDWSESHTNTSVDIVTNLLLQELTRLSHNELHVIQQYTHRWLYSQVNKGLASRKGFMNDGSGLILLGDYIHPVFKGVESAWMSAKLYVDSLYAG